MIIYFSATGNSKYAAEKIAALANDYAYSIREDIKSGSFAHSLKPDEALGIISPVYWWGLPSVMADYLRKLNLTVSENHYVYSVTTYGTTTGSIVSQENKLLQEKGLKIDASFCIRMPDTWTPIFNLSDKEKNSARLRSAENELEAVIQHINRRDAGSFNHKQVPAFIGNIASGLYDMTRCTSKLTVNENCIGCGLCARQCPVEAIKMENGRPVWVKEKCALCLGCLHRCPEFAIRCGKMSGKHGQYVNPNTKL